MASLLLLSHGDLAAPLSDALRRHNPALLIVCVSNAEQLGNAFDTAGRFDRLVAFCTETIVSAAQLAALGGPAYNFHPAPPGYPGSFPASFAIYDGASRFGATAHEMAVRVDSGPIVDVEWFDIAPGSGVLALEDRAGEAAARLFWRLAPLLAHCAEKLPIGNDQWGARKTTKKDFRAMGVIDASISPEELERRWRAFAARDPAVLQLDLHGRRFVLADPQPPSGGT